MGRKKKLINKTDIPQYAVERFARCVFDDIRAAYADQEVQEEFARWQAQRAELNTTKKRAAVVAALFFFVFSSARCACQRANSACTSWSA